MMIPSVRAALCSVLQLVLVFAVGTEKRKTREYNRNNHNLLQYYYICTHTHTHINNYYNMICRRMRTEDVILRSSADRGLFYLKNKKKKVGRKHRCRGSV